MRQGFKIHGAIIKIDFTPIVTSYFIFKACKEIGLAITSKVVCDHLDDINDFINTNYKKDKKDEKPVEE